MENQQTPFGGSTPPPQNPQTPQGPPQRGWQPPIARTAYDAAARRPAQSVQPQPAPMPITPQPVLAPQPQTAVPQQPISQPVVVPSQQEQYRFGGADANQHAPQPPKAKAPAEEGASSKKFMVAWLLAFLLGSLGADRFYLGRYGTAAAKLVTAGGLGVWSLIDFVRLGLGKITDKQHLPLAGYRQKAHTYRTITLVGSAVYALGVVVFLIAIVVLMAIPTLQASGKNTQRKNDISNLANSFNQYYAKNKAYPPLSTVNGPDFTGEQGGFDISKTHDPDWSQKDTACTGQNGQPLLAALAAPHCYVYEPRAANGSTCNNISITCTQATLTAFLRGKNAFVLHLQNGQ